MDFLKQLYWGKISLARTFWLYGVVGAIVLSIGVNIALAIHIIWLAYFILGFRFIYMVFIYGAIWNSARNYKGSIWWSVLAKLWIVISAISIINNTLEVLWEK